MQNKNNLQANCQAVCVPFLNVRVVHVIPYDAQDVECHSLNVSACIAGVRLGGGMNYAESLLHRFGILGPDGGPGDGLTKGLEQLSAGPLSKLFKASPLVDELRESLNSKHFSCLFAFIIPDKLLIFFSFQGLIYLIISVLFG